LARLLLLPAAGRMVNRAHSRGYTLVELMVVVVMVAVLATLAVYGVRRYVFAAKSSEFNWVIQDIKAAQESFRLETHRYLHISDVIGVGQLYPNANPNADKQWWGRAGGGPLEETWRVLNLSYPEPVQFGYACAAGGPTDAVPQPGTAETLPWPTPTEPWYVVKGVGDLDEDDKNSIYVSSSFSAHVYIENEGE
jgi:prepilin-type N-terminal cleavage/methylation domain-containing protein